MKLQLPENFQKRQFQRQARWLCFLIIIPLIWFTTTTISLTLCLCTLGAAARILLYSRSGNRIPALMYHSVSAKGQWLQQPNLVMSSASFEAQLQWLKKHGYKTLQLDELFHGRSSLSGFGKAVVLTFDDGYLDAWVAVEPLLEQYSSKGTVFVSTGWIEKGNTPRPQLPQAGAKNLIWEGYLNRSEVRLLKKRGILDVQSHGFSHDRIFTGHRIDTFVTRDPPPLWLYLLHHPESRTSWLNTSCMLPKGKPVFQSGEALAAPAFLPNPEFCRELEKTAAENIHLSSGALHRLLFKKAKKLREEGWPVGQEEAPGQTTTRWREELLSSKQVLEHLTGHAIKHFCWPCNTWSSKGEAIALETGYLSTANGDDHNGPEKPWRVSRVHMGGIGIPAIDLLRFILEIQVFRGHYWLWPPLLILQKVMGKIWQVQRKKQTRRGRYGLSSQKIQLEHD